MLARRILLPAALDGPLDGAGLALLRDLVDCALVIVGQRDWHAAAVDKVRDWPEPFRARAVELLRQLHLRRRLISVAATPEGEGSCQSPICAELRGAAAQTGVVVICAGDCCTEPGPREVINITGYGASGLPDTCRSSGMFRAVDGETTADSFERIVLRPLLRYTQRVTVIDRQIGRTVRRDHSATFIRAEYADTLSWIASEYASAGRAPRRELKIVTGVDSRYSPARDADALRRFAARVATDCGISVVCELALEWPHQMDHDRYLVTDQTALQIGRGFDLLWTDRAMRDAGLDPRRDERRLRDTTVVRLPIWGEVETAHLRLPAA